MQCIDVIQQRKTIKLFDKNHQIPRETLMEMIDLAQLAPSKANLQPWRFVIIDDPAQKNQLLDVVAFNAPPCETASALILILADQHYDQLIETLLDRSIEAGCLDPAFKQTSYDFLVTMHQGLSEQQIRDQVLIDTSLASMQLMLIAKEKGYDTHAIGIFDRQAVLSRLKVDEKRYLPVMLLAIGKAAVPAIPSARLPAEYTVSWNSGENFKK